MDWLPKPSLPMHRLPTFVGAGFIGEARLRPGHAYGDNGNIPDLVVAVGVSGCAGVYVESSEASDESAVVKCC